MGETPTRLDRAKTIARQRMPRVYGGVWTVQRRIVYRGDGFGCPLCGHTFGRWLVPPDELWREICPYCRSEARHRALWLWLPTTNLLASRHRVLHFAPEPLVQAKLKALPNLDHLSADLTSPIADRRIDVTDIPFGDGSFDIIFCSHVLEHVPDDRRAMAELYRVLAPEGWALLLAPYAADRDTEEALGASPEERLRRFGQSDHVRLYGRDYPDRLRSSGFAVDQEIFAERLDPSIVRYYGLYREEMFFVGRKSS